MDIKINIMGKLLDKIKKVPVNKSRPVEKNMDEWEQIALSWTRGEITHGQIARGMGLSNTGTRVYAKLALSLKYHLNKNK